MRERSTRSSKIQQLFLIGVIVSVTSQLYLHPGEGSFRISASVILYAVMLVWLVGDTRVPMAGLVTMAVVFLFRTVWSMVSGVNLMAAMLAAVPGALFYFCYDLIFCILAPNRQEKRLTWLCCIIFLADLLSNIVELCLSALLRQTALSLELVWWLAAAALIRTVCVGGVLFGMRYYKKLILLEQHERRYQRLFLMTAQLWDELYFLKKNIDEIETVMRNAYRLYETLGKQKNTSPETQRLALSIAKDVHEIKKDNLRIMRGIEAEVEEVYDREEMLFSELMKILKQATQDLLGEKQAKIQIQCDIAQDFSTREHYRLLTVIRNLVTNAIEAIDMDTGEGYVLVTQWRSGDDQVFLIQDNGPGIPEKARESVFQMGYSTKFNPVTGDINRGVGLPAVQSMIEDEFGGSIVLQTGQGTGCCFQVRIPCHALEGGEA